MHCQWRGCEDWKNIGLPLSTTSNEASKAFDATVTQYVGWYDDTSVGGIEASAEKMIQADPNFVMGHVLKNGLDVMGTGRSTKLDLAFKKDVENMVALSKSQTVSDREKNHVTAIKLWANGSSAAACDVWEDILVDYPHDILALKFAHDSYFYLGYSNQMRDGIARVLPRWKPTMPLYGYVIGMYSFGLEETNLYDLAEKAARQGLEINPRDAWSTHSLNHVWEMTGRHDEGIVFLTDTVKDWSSCGMLACHNFWHWSLFYMEKGDYQNALKIFDNEVNVRFGKSGAMLDLVDACALLYRLEMEGVDIGNRWNDVFELSRPHLDDHIMAFNDVHILMSCLGAKQNDVTAKMMKSIEQFVRDGTGNNRDITRDVGEKLMESFVAYGEGDFGKAVDILNPVRYKVILIGGSNAQRDLFNLFLIQAALKSPLKKHHRLASIDSNPKCVLSKAQWEGVSTYTDRTLLMERKSFKDCSPMTDRLMKRAMAMHVD